MKEDTQEIHCFITGRVQLVMYRDFVKRGARSLGLTGFVRNLNDGSVEVLAQGSKENLEKLIARMHRGSLFSHVAEVGVEWRQPAQEHRNFSIV